MMKRTLWYVCLGLLCCGALAMVVSAATNNPASTVTTKSANGSGPSNVNPKAVTPSTSIATRQIHAQTNVPPVAKAPAFESAKGEDVDRAFERALNGHSRPGDKEILAGYIPVQNHADPNPLDQGADNCPATAFSALPYSDGGTTVGYVNNFAESCVFDGGAPDVIYAYTAGVNSTVRVSLVGSGYDTGLSVRTGGACPGTTEVACNDDFTGLQSQVDVVVTSGTVYFIVVDGYSSSSGTYTLNVTDIGGVRPCPVMEPDDANLDPMPTSPWAGSIAGNCGNGGKWVGEFTGVAGHEYHFDLCPDAPGAGTCWGDADIKICDAAGTILAGIDGSCTAITWAPNNFQWSAPAAGSYYVVIAPYYSYGVHSCTGTASETFTMQYYDAGACTPPTPNDNCANAGGPWTPPATITGNNGCSTHDCSFLTNGEGESWEMLVLPSTCDLKISYCGTTPVWGDVYIILETGCPCTGTWVYAGDWNQTECADGNWTVNFYGVPAGTYYYPVMREASFQSGGPYTIQIVCATYPNGRCCYGNPQAPSCQDVSQPACATLGGVWDGTLNCTANPCPVCDVVSTGTPEGESCNPVQDTNGGCNSPTPIFQEIQCGAHIAGQSYFDGSTRDTDWYQLTGLIANNYTMTVTAEFDLQIIILFPNPDCSNYTYVVATGGPCQPVTLSSGDVGPGPVWFWVGPQFTNTFTCGEYDMTISTTVACTCDPATALTVHRGTGLANSVSLRWYAAQTQGLYRVFGTTNMNNDGDPNNGADPDWTLVTEVAAPAAPGYLTATDSPLVPRAQYAVVHDCAPRGRCCYGDPQNPQCASPVTQEYCDGLAGTWALGMTCADPCPIVPVNDNCEWVTPVALPATFTGTRDGATPDCPLFVYGEGNVWIAFTTTSTCNIVLDYCGTTGGTPPGNVWLNLALGCPCTGASPAASYNATTCPDGNYTLTWNNMAAGTYYYPVLSDAVNGATGPYTINVTCSAPPPCTVDYTLTAPGNVSGNTANGTDDCSNRVGLNEIVQVTIPTASNWSFSLCPGSGWDTYLILSDACCGTILASNDDYCSLTSEINCVALSAGTYYVDVEPFGSSTGPWTLVVSNCNNPNTYCAASHSTCDEYIGNVTVGSINNTTTCTAGGYNDYTAISTNMTIGTGYPITVHNPVAYASDATGVWVDWNNNFSFADAGEYTLLAMSDGGANFAGTITPPAGSSGNHRMRVRIGYSWTPNPCGTTTYGETEDYTIIVP